MDAVKIARAWNKNVYFLHVRIFVIACIRHFVRVESRAMDAQWISQEKPAADTPKQLGKSRLPPAHSGIKGVGGSKQACQHDTCQASM